jgi:predicted Fe-S protein YdhL (DUF1289 family)
MAPSPCINVCQVDRQRGLCRGCGRTLAEIAGWSRFDEAEKRRVNAVAAQRLEQA